MGPNAASAAVGILPARPPPPGCAAAGQTAVDAAMRFARVLAARIEVSAGGVRSAAPRDRLVQGSPCRIARVQGAGIGIVQVQGSADTLIGQALLRGAGISVIALGVGLAAARDAVVDASAR